MYYEVGRWADLQPLKQYVGAPSYSGIYEIGFRNPGHNNPVQFSPGYPSDFQPVYVGLTTRSIRARLSRHYRERGNRHIATYQQVLNKLEKNGVLEQARKSGFGAELFYTSRLISSETRTATKQLIRYFEARRMFRVGHYKWNIRSEFRSLGEPDGFDFELL